MNFLFERQIGFYISYRMINCNFRSHKYIIYREIITLCIILFSSSGRRSIVATRIKSACVRKSLLFLNVTSQSGNAAYLYVRINSLTRKPPNVNSKQKHDRREGPTKSSRE